MDKDVIDKLNRLNARFYRENHDSFGRTRQAAWPGWARIVERLGSQDATGTLRLLDVACGNMRFEKFLVDALPDIELQATCIDSCDDLATQVDGCVFQHADIIESILQNNSPLERWYGSYDAVVSFGFFHHVPSGNLRSRLLEELVKAASPHGFVAVSLWRFASDEKMRAKAERTTAEAFAALDLAGALEKGDYLIGWNDVPGVYRYCHSFSESEIDNLVASVAAYADLQDRYVADGRTSALNEYLLFRVR